MIASNTNISMSLYRGVLQAPDGLDMFSAIKTENPCMVEGDMVAGDGERRVITGVQLKRKARPLKMTS